MSWTSIPSAPVPGEYAHAVWTGTEAIFISVGTDPSRLQGEAFDPSSGTWQVMPQSPLTPRSREMAAWTGQELIVWGGGKLGDPANTSGAAYVPSTNAWHTIADAPIGLNQGDAVWTGHEMLVFGSLLNNGNVASTKNAVGAEYDPATDTWSSIPPSSLSPQATSAVWLGGNGLLAWDYEAHAQVGDMHAQVNDGASNTWGEVQSMPFEPGECYPDSALLPNVSGNTVFAWYCGQAAIWDSVTGMWNQVHGGPTEPTVQANGRSFKLFRFADLVPAGNVLVLAAEGITVGKGGEPCYGCPGAPHSYWAYRPPSDAPTPAEFAPRAFAPADGWHTISTSTDPRVVDPEAAPTAWAANVPFDPSDLAGRTANGALTDAYFPSNTMKSLPKEGVVIVASLAGRRAGASPNVNFQARTLPLRLSDAQVLDSWEGQVAPNVPEYRLLATVDGRWLEVRVYFGTLAPSASTLQAAQEELSRLQLPSRAG